MIIENVCQALPKLIVSRNTSILHHPNKTKPKQILQSPQSCIACSFLTVLCNESQIVNSAECVLSDNSVNLQTTVQEYVTQSLVAKNQTHRSGEVLTAVTVFIFACLFIYIQKIIYFTSSSQQIVIVHHYSAYIYLKLLHPRYTSIF